jgi:putative DNA primase/helicase
VYALTLQRFHEAWPAEPGKTAPALPVVTLQQAFEGVYDDWRHIWPGYCVAADGSVINPMPRLFAHAAPALKDAGVTPYISCLIADIDGAEHKASDAWRNLMIERFATLPPHAWYATRGGFRVVMLPDHPIALGDWEQTRDGFWEILRQCGIFPDTNCSSWTWLYALPYVTRDDSKEVLRYPADWSKLAPISASWVRSLAKAVSTRDALGGVSGAKQDLREGVILGDSERTNGLMRLAGKLRAQGLSADVIEVALLKVNEQQCNPPLPEAKVIGMARSVGRYETRGTIQPDAHTVAPSPAAQISVLDDALSTLIAKQAQRESRFFDLRQSLHNALVATVAQETSPVDGCLFRRGSDIEFASLLRKTLTQHTVEPVAVSGAIWRFSPDRTVWEMIPDTLLHSLQDSLDGEKVLVGHDKSGAPTARPVALTKAKRELSASVLKDSVTVLGFFDHPKAGAPFQNGVISAGAGGVSLEPHRPEHRLRWQFDFALDSPDAVPVDWLAGLARIFAHTEHPESQIQLLREWMGLSIMGLATTPICSKAILLLGSGNNGKSKTIEIIAALHPPGSVVSIDPQRMNDPYYAAQLDGAAINMVAEGSSDNMVKADKFKAAITGDLLPARHPYGRPFYLINKAGFLVAINELMAVSEHTPAFWRRWCALSFNRKFLPHEEDHTWHTRVIRNELPAVALWAVQGASDAIKRGRLHECPTSAKLVAHWRKETDQVATFVEDVCEITAPTAEQGTDLMTLYTTYTRWATVVSSARPLALRNFAPRLEQVGVRTSAKISTASGRRFAGVRITNQQF